MKEKYDDSIMAMIKKRGTWHCNISTKVNAVTVTQFFMKQQEVA